MAPVLSEKAVLSLSNLVGSDVEFLSFHNLSDRRYFVMNVLQCEDYLDLDRSDLTPLMESYVLKKNIPDDLPPIFKCKGQRGTIFVTSPFAEVMANNDLRGASLADPAQRIVEAVLAGRVINRYPRVQP